MKLKRLNMRYIYPAPHGFIVNDVVNGKKVYFSSVNYGGRIQARQEAIHYRDNMFKTLNVEHGYIGNLASPHNSTDIIGVAMKKRVATAYWMEDGKRKTKSFSIKKYGYDKAKELATICRLAHAGIGGFLENPLSSITKTASKKAKRTKYIQLEAACIN